MTRIDKVAFKVSGIVLFYFFVLLAFLSCSSDEGAAVDISNEEENTINPIDTSIDGLPLFSINTNGATIVDEPKINADASVSMDGSVDFSGKIGIEIRGSSSQPFPKKSYGFERWDDSSQDVDASILGFPEEEDWILYGPFSDKSLMRNVLIYDLSSDMKQYASRTKFVELNLNGTYRGVYVFMEKLKRDKERIDIAKLNEDENTGEDLTGGYVIKIDKNDNGGFTSQNSFVSQFGSSLREPSTEVRILFEYPKPEDLTSERRDYITTYVNDVESALASDTYMDPVNGYDQYIDVDSFVDYFILNELSNNVDGYRISTFMHKNKNEKLKMGPLCDFNLGFGYADYCSGGATDVWAYQFNERCPDDFYQVPFWWSRLMEDPAFVSRLQSRCNELRGNILSEGNIFAKVDSYIDVLDKTESIDKNFQTWNVLGTYVWPNSFVGETYNQEIDFLKSWISDRLNGMDTTITGLL